MKKFMQKRLKNEKGMTLIELLAVIVILAIIAAIAIPAIGNIIENSRYSAVKSDASNVLSAANIYFTENPDDADNKASLGELKDGYLDSAGSFKDFGDDEVYVSSTNPNKLTAPAIEFSTGKNLKFTDASQDQINGDNTKGSSIEAETTKTIGTQP